MVERNAGRWACCAGADWGSRIYARPAKVQTPEAGKRSARLRFLALATGERFEDTMTETTTITEATALQWLAELFEEPARNLTPDTLRAEIPAWDSLGVLTLMAALDERFGILLTDQEMRAMTNVGDILEVLRRHGKLNGE